MPNSTAGMIIGKGGNYIKKLKDESGAYVQISQKAKDQTLQERCITVIGTLFSGHFHYFTLLLQIGIDYGCATAFFPVNSCCTHIVSLIIN